VTRHLLSAGVEAAAIHGNKSQNNRERALAGFKDGSTKVLVATDIAARGIDVDGVSHVVNFDLPDVAETYVHRIGRTARAGAQGLAIAFCSADENGNWRAIEALIRQRVPIMQVEGNRSTAAAAAAERVDEQRRFVPRGRPAGASGRDDRGGTQRPAGPRPANGRGPQGGHRSGPAPTSGQRGQRQAAR
jgi:ATP-dependent RNA helicase RhlE